MKTAMQELEYKLKDNLKWIVMNADYELMDKLFKEGFEKEKEQIIAAFKTGYNVTEYDADDYFDLLYNQNK